MPVKVFCGQGSHRVFIACIGLFAAIASAQQVGYSPSPAGASVSAAASDPVVSQAPSGLPLLTSNPGAAYTIYLDFGGFTFTGTWGGGVSNPSPGVTPAYDDAVGSFSAGEISNIRNVWARVAQKYTGFNVNVTTVDPAVAAGQAGTDAARQAYYDSQAQMMHTVIGGSGAWSGGGGVSYVGVTKNAYSPTGFNSNAGRGYHTDWIFSDEATNNLQFIGEASSHENGHGFGLNHQSDFNGSTLSNEYSTNNNFTGNNSYAPIMGDSYNVQRGTWRVGNSDSGGGALATQNDVKVIVNNPNMSGFVDDAIGHTRITAIPVTLAGSAINPGVTRGWITPVSAASPNPIGAGNYTTDFFSFASDGVTPISLTVNDGTELLNVGTADPGATLKSTLAILDSTGATVGNGTLAVNTLSETYNGTLPAGVYYAQVSSFGGNNNTNGGTDTSGQYYDMGAYFLTGTGLVAVPEPVVMMLMPFVGLLVRRRAA
jgi:hypothetical protein